MVRIEKLERKGGYGKFMIALAMLALATVLAVGAFFLMPAPRKQVTVNISPGSSSGEIASVLAGNGVIRNAFLFKLYISRRHAQGRLQAGKYRLETGMTFEEALNALLKGPSIRYYKVVVPEGMTVEQTAETVAKNSPISKEEFLGAAVRSKYDFAFLEGLPDNSLEGFLFPKTYTVTDEMSAEDLVKMMLKQFSEETKSLDMTVPSQKGMTLFNIVTIASIIEKEVRLAEERPLVSAVVYNRLNQGMYLQMCATVQYALPEYKDELSYSDLEVESPYNTYKYPGLPPGPICSPGLASLEAAVKPAPVGYLYYVLTGKDGSHTFTNDYEEFVRVKEERGI